MLLIEGGFELHWTLTGDNVIFAATFDSLAAARSLKAAGIDADQAEAIATQLRAATEADRGELVTRGVFYRALWIQGAGIVAILGALRFLPI